MIYIRAVVKIEGKVESIIEAESNTIWDHVKESFGMIDEQDTKIEVILSPAIHIGEETA